MSCNNFITFIYIYIYKLVKTHQINIIKIKKKNLRKTFFKVFLKKKNKQQIGREEYKNLPEVENEKLVEYRKNIIKWEKPPYYNHKRLLFKKEIT